MTAFLQRFTNVRREEIVPILFAALYFFCILTALGVLRPAREALGMQGGMDAIRWLFMMTLVATLAVNPFFGLLVAKYRRMTFISATYLFFVFNLVAFYALLVLTPQSIGERTGQVFYVWMSVFNLFLTALFWSLMADRFSLEQGKRFFPLIAVGGTVGAIFGAAQSAFFAERLGTPQLLLLAGGFLVAALGAAFALTRIQPERPRSEREAEEHAVIGGSAIEGLRAVMRSPYLAGVAGYIMLITIVATWLYFTRLEMVAAIGEGVDMRAGIFARIDALTQTTTLVLQAIVAGHLIRRLGVAVTLTLLPVTVALGFVGLAIVGSLVALVVFEASFRAVQRAIVRPARETLFTVVSREDKYKAKVFADTFVYRGGDAIGAQTQGLFAGAGMAVLSIMAVVAVPLAAIWAILGIRLGRAQLRIAAAERPPRAAGPVRAERIAH